MKKMLLGALLLLTMMYGTADARVLRVLAGSESSLRSQIAAAVEGDVVVVPPGTYALSAAATITTGCKIIGGGVSQDTTATVGPTTITVNAARNAFTIDNSAATITGLEIRNLTITGSGGSTLDAIGFAGTAAKKLTMCVFDRLNISGFNNGINLQAADASTGAGVHITISNCNITTNRTRGITLGFCSMARVERCEVNNSGANGVFANTCLNFAIRDCAIETNNTANGKTLEGDAQCLIKLSHQFVVSGLDVEAMPGNADATKVGLAISNCLGGTIQSYNCSATFAAANSIALRLSTSTSGVRLNSMNTTKIAQAIAVDATSTAPSYDTATVLAN